MKANSKNTRNQNYGNEKKKQTGFKDVQKQMKAEAAAQKAAEIAVKKEVEWDLLLSSMDVLDKKILDIYNLRIDAAANNTFVPRDQTQIIIQQVTDHLAISFPNEKLQGVANVLASVLVDVARCHVNPRMDVFRSIIRTMYFFDKAHTYFGELYTDDINSLSDEFKNLFNMHGFDEMLFIGKDGDNDDGLIFKKFEIPSLIELEVKNIVSACNECNTECDIEDDEARPIDILKEEIANADEILIVIGDTYKTFSLPDMKLCGSGNFKDTESESESPCCGNGECTCNSMDFAVKYTTKDDSGVPDVESEEENTSTETE